VVVTDAQGKPVSSADSAAAMNAAPATASASATGAPAGATTTALPGTGVWLNYDFIPGDRVLFYDDFADDHVGDLPSGVDVSGGNATIVDVQGHKYLRTANGTRFVITLPEALPQRFTIEATYHNAGGNGGSGLRFIIGSDTKGHDVSVECHLPEVTATIKGTGPNGGKDSQQQSNANIKDFAHCRFMFDGGYVKAYVENERLAQLNGLTFGRGTKITVEVPGGNDATGASLVSDIRIAEGGKKLYDALASSGRVSTHGILFATGSAQLQPESTPTLKEIGDMLQQHPDLKLTIEGHTDNVGEPAANQTLSDQRAAAVKQFLVSSYGIAADRLQTKGFGATKPVASNDTPQGRQQNRRVELVKM
jgi:outer membrane protein OmpA-like peptidoglycan-associated protein